MGFPGGTSGKEPTCQCRRHEILVPSLGQEDTPAGGCGNPLQYSCLRNPWTEEPGELQSTGSQRVEHDWSDLAYTQVGDEAGELSDVVVIWESKREKKDSFFTRTQLKPWTLFAITLPISFSFLKKIFLPLLYGGLHTELNSRARKHGPIGSKTDKQTNKKQTNKQKTRQAWPWYIKKSR